jgi:transcriptional regulator with XRE-family HTH domain
MSRTYDTPPAASQAPDLRRAFEGEVRRFPERLKEAMGEESVRGFAKRTGVSSSVVHNYLRGKSEPTRPILLALANAAKVNPLWLATGEGPMWPKHVETASPAKPDEQLLEAAIAAVEEVLEERGLELKPGKKAKLVSTLYEMAQEEGKKVEKATVLRLVRLAV